MATSRREQVVLVVGLLDIVSRSSSLGCSDISCATSSSGRVVCRGTLWPSIVVAGPCPP